MDNMQAGFIAASSPTPKLPEPPAPEEPKGPSEVDLLRQEIQGLQKQYGDLRSNKDTTINDLKQQLDLLNTTLQDKLAPKTVSQPVHQEPTSSYVDDLWNNYLGMGQQQQTQAQPPKVEEEAMDPKEFEKLAKKAAKEVIKSEVQTANEKMNAAQIKNAELRDRWSSQYTHLHHAQAQINELYNTIAAANPKLDQEDIFNRTMQTAEKLFPQQQSSAPSFPTGGQMSMSQPSIPGNRQMLKGLPVRDAGQQAQQINDYVLERKGALNRRLGRASY